MADSVNPVILYDGVCGLCNRLIRFVLKHDREARFRFASLQSDYAAAILKNHRLDPDDLEAVYLVQESSAPLAGRSDAVISVLRGLGGLWAAIAVALLLFPKSLRDWGYRVVARNRYRIFGKYESCPVPDKEYQGRFLNG